MNRLSIKQQALSSKPKHFWIAFFFNIIPILVALYIIISSITQNQGGYPDEGVFESGDSAVIKFYLIILLVTLLLMYFSRGLSLIAKLASYLSIFWGLILTAGLIYIEFYE